MDEGQKDDDDDDNDDWVGCDGQEPGAYQTTMTRMPATMVTVLIDDGHDADDDRGVVRR